MQYNIVMRRHQAEQYFQQLKKIDSDKGMSLSEMVNVLTGGGISVKHVDNFVTYVTSNEFGQYNFVEPYLTVRWTTLTFPQAYQVLKAVKDYVNKEKGIAHFGLLSEQSERSRIISRLKNRSEQSEKSILEDIRELDATPDPVMEERQYAEKWKNSRLKVIKKLLVIFDYFRKTVHDKHESFDKNKELTERFDLTLFMKYFREFEMGGAFEVQKAVKLFKNNATNQIWLTFDGFVNVHMDLINLKENLPSKEKYLRVRGLGQLLSSQKMKKMLNVRVKSVVADLVQGHTGAYKQDVINHLKEVQRERERKRRWRSGKSLKTQPSTQGIDHRPKHISSAKRIKSESGPSVYEELQLPKLRMKEQRQESIYQSLKQLDFTSQVSKIRTLIDVSQNQSFLKQYLKQEEHREEKKKRTKSKSKELDLPRMKFT